MCINDINNRKIQFWIIKYCKTKQALSQFTSLYLLIPWVALFAFIFPFGPVFQWRGLWLRAKSLSRNRTDWDQILPEGLWARGERCLAPFVLGPAGFGTRSLVRPPTARRVRCGSQQACLPSISKIEAVFCRFSMPPLIFAFSWLDQLVSYTRWNSRNKSHLFNLWPKKVSEQLSQTLKCWNVLALHTKYQSKCLLL